jgi:hypothetical protein
MAFVKHRKGLVGLEGQILGRIKVRSAPASCFLTESDTHGADCWGLYHGLYAVPRPAARRHACCRHPTHEAALTSSSAACRERAHSTELL